MEKLDSLLKNTERAGVYASKQAIEFEHASAKNNFAFFRIDFSHITNKEQLLSEIEKKLMFPDYFGHNWDALNDCLTDFSWLPAPGYAILLDQSAVFAKSSPEEFDTVVEIFEEAADFWKEEHKPFWVIVTEVGPDTQIKTLSID